jgi:hypothetical protein
MNHSEIKFCVILYSMRFSEIHDVITVISLKHIYGMFTVKSCRNSPVSFAILYCVSACNSIIFHIGEFDCNVLTVQFWLKSDNCNEHFT